MFANAVTNYYGKKAGSPAILVPLFFWFFFPFGNKINNYYYNDLPFTQHQNFPRSRVPFTLKAPSNALLNNIHNTRPQTIIQMRRSTTKWQKTYPWRTCRVVDTETIRQSRSLQSFPGTENPLWCTGTQYISYAITKCEVLRRNMKKNSCSDRLNRLTAS